MFGYAAVGITASVTIPTSSLFSVTWFPVSQRTTATTIVSSSTFIGFTVAYLTGKLSIVKLFNSIEFYCNYANQVLRQLEELTN